MSNSCTNNMSKIMYNQNKKLLATLNRGIKETKKKCNSRIEEQYPLEKTVMKRMWSITRPIFPLEKEKLTIRLPFGSHH